jgi:hypothetical protein
MPARAIDSVNGGVAVSVQDAPNPTCRVNRSTGGLGWGARLGGTHPLAQLLHHLILAQHVLVHLLAHPGCRSSDAELAGSLTTTPTACLALGSFYLFVIRACVTASVDLL